jgi:hypothetical protein
VAFVWGRSKKGRWVVQRKTAKDRFSRALREVGRRCRAHRHWCVAEQWSAWSRKLQGHYAYYGIAGNARVGSFSLCGATAVAQVAQPTLLAGRHDVGVIRPLVPALSAPPGACRSQCLPSRSDSVTNHNSSTAEYLANSSICGFDSATGLDQIQSQKAGGSRHERLFL